MSKEFLRQNKTNRFIHWGVAFSIMMLIISGIGQLPVYRRYNVDKLPGGDWLANFFNTLNLHYLGAILLIFVVTFHLVYHSMRKKFDILPKKGDLKQSFIIIKAMLTGGKEPPAEKYLAEQRLAYAGIGFTVLLLIITGLVKVAKNLPGFDLPQALIAVSTHLHNLGTVLLILGILSHLGAILIKANRPLIRGMLTGYVEEEYAKERHSLWYDRVIRMRNSKKATKAPVDLHGQISRQEVQ